MEIEGYQLGREVSSGAYCSVYNALDIETSITVSIRVYNHTLSANENFCNEFGKAIKPLINQKIGIMVPVRQALADAQNCYVVTDYFHSSQQQFESTLTFSTQQLLQFGQRLASTLELLHGRQLVHGGIEASNILFTAQSQIVLGFMALHKTLPSISHISIPTANLEQAMYLAPEAQQGLTAATDFYALGILLYQLLDMKDPFEADDLQQLEQRKTALELNFSNNENESLRPLFNQLLDPDPQQRISTAEQFHQALKSCGYTVKQPIYSTPPEPEPAPEIQPTAETDSDSTAGIMQNKMLLTAVAGTIFLAVILFFVFSDSTQEPAGPDDKTAPIAEKSMPPVAIEVGTEEAVEMSRAEFLYQDALQSVKLKNYGSALMSANNALKENPDHQQVKRLKIDIERELEARAMISKAEKQITQKKLTKPPTDNAFETYKQLAELLPAEDKRAQQGLEKIAAYYYGLAKIEFSKNNIGSAREHISSGYSVRPNFALLQELELDIQQHQQKLAQQRQQAKINADKARKERQLQKQQKLAQQQRAQKLLQEKQQQQQIKDQKINDQLADARQDLVLSRLSLSSITSAKTTYNDLNNLYQNDERITGLKQDILDAYGILAINQKNANQYNSALITVTQGLSMDRQNENLKLIKNEIDTLIAIRNKPVVATPKKPTQRNNPVPVIPTF